MKKQVMMKNVAEWVGMLGDGLEGMPTEERRDILRLILDQVIIDRDNSISITLGIFTQGLVSIENESSRRK